MKTSNGIGMVMLPRQAMDKLTLVHVGVSRLTFLYLRYPLHVFDVYLVSEHIEMGDRRRFPNLPEPHSAVIETEMNNSVVGFCCCLVQRLAAIKRLNAGSFRYTNEGRSGVHVHEEPLSLLNLCYSS